jgi:hypothetical protein
LCNLVAQSPRNAQEQFEQEVEKELNAGEAEPWEIIYFKLYRNREENSLRVWKKIAWSAVFQKTA